VWRDWGQRGAVAPGRMGPPASAAWTLAGLAIVLSRHTWGRALTTAGGFAVTVIGALSLLGYVYGTEPLYAIPRWTTIALQTALMVFAVGVGLVMAVPERGLGGLLTRRDAGGIMARRLLAPVIILSVLLGGLRISGQEAGLYDTRFGTAARTLVELVSLVVLVWWIGRGLSRTDQARARHQAALQRELEAGLALQDVSTQLIPTDEVRTLYERIVDAAIAITRADFGSLQMLDRDRGELRLLVHRGFSARAARRWEWVPATSATCYGRALSSAIRCIVSDVEHADLMAGTDELEAFRETGIRAMQTTPLVSRHGELIGMISTHWRAPHAPEESELRLMDVLARQAADAFDRGHSVEALRRSEERFRSLATVLRDSERTHRLLAEIGVLAAGSGTAGGPGIAELSETIIGSVAVAMSVSRCALSRVDLDAGRVIVEHDASSGLPSIRGSYPIADTVAHLVEDGIAGRTTVITDLASDPRTAARYEDAYQPRAIRAYINVPLHREGRWVGNFWVSSHEARAWTEGEIDLMQTVAGGMWLMLEQVRTASALRESEARLAGEARRKDEFLATLAHELRNPLAPVRNAAYFLKRKDLKDPELRRPVEMIDRQVAQMARLIDDLLDVSRITRGMLELRLEPLQFDDVVEAAVDASRDEIRARGQTLRVTPAREPVALVADRARLIQVLSNLIANASKYTRSGGEIDLVAAAHGKRLEVSVRDNGIGIPPDKLDEIFELFAQVDRSFERQGGLGIGLTLVRQVVELHGGTVEARSPGVGHGSEFIIRLPIAEPAAAAGTAPPAFPEPAGEPRQVLVADDNHDTVESLKLLLQMNGHRVRTAFDGEQAIASASEHPPDVALLDIGMPKLNGYDVARRIRAQAWGKAVRLVAMSGWGQEDDRRRAIDAGFDDHFVKPVPPEVLRALLASLGAGNGTSKSRS
jgi:signal transduction histidine kinase/ActR/RegA family two-component response regulator